MRYVSISVISVKRRCWKKCWKIRKSGFNTLVSMRVLRTLIRMRSVVTGRSTNVILSRWKTMSRIVWSLGRRRCVSLLIRKRFWHWSRSLMIVRICVSVVGCWMRHWAVASSSPKFRPISRLFVRLWRGKIVPSSKNRSLNWRGLSTVSLIRIMRRWLIRR